MGKIAHLTIFMATRHTTICTGNLEVLAVTNILANTHSLFISFSFEF